MGLLFVGGGAVETARGRGLDNLLNVVAGIVFVLVGLEMAFGRIEITPDGVALRRLARSRFIARAAIRGVAVGPAAQMFVGGQRTVVLELPDESLALNMLARYAKPASETLLLGQVDLIKQTLADRE